jgi:hypothetical protein
MVLVQKPPSATATCKKQNKKRMLLNLSNHPSVNWSPEQRAAAERQFGGVADLAFPHIDPTATTAEVKKILKNPQETSSN